MTVGARGFEQNDGLYRQLRALPCQKSSAQVPYFRGIQCRRLLKLTTGSPAFLGHLKSGPTVSVIDRYWDVSA